jgi:hypothetical protein
MYNSPQSFARGGRASKHHKGLTKVHMSPHELTILDHLQGGPEYGHEGIKAYSHLEELLKNPHIVQNVHKHAHAHRQHHAHGGLTPAMEHLREGGRFGDSELAMIGPHTHHLFNQLAGHATRNPHTGHPEYFSLGGALSGLWNTVKGIGAPILDVVKGVASPVLNMLGIGGGGGGGGESAPAPTQSPPPSYSDAFRGIAQAAAPTFLPMAQEALGNRFGDMGRMAGNMLSQRAQSALGEPSGQMNPYYSAIGRGLGRAAESYRGGASPSQAFGHGLQRAGSGIGGNFGSGLEEMGNSMGSGRNFMESARSGVQRGMRRALPAPANQQYEPYGEQGEDYSMYG